MSSTIGNEREESLRNGKPYSKPGCASSRKLGLVRQREFLALMTQGASPQVACRKMHVAMAAFWKTLESDANFAAELQRVWDTLSLNVVAALYQAAIKGNGSAQQFWLKHRPPPYWAVPVAETNPTDDLEDLSDAELLDRARTEAPDLAAEIAARLAATGSGRASADVPQSGARPRERAG